MRRGQEHAGEDGGCQGYAAISACAAQRAQYERNADEGKEDMDVRRDRRQ